MKTSSSQLHDYSRITTGTVDRSPFTFNNLLLQYQPLPEEIQRSINNSTFSKRLKKGEALVSMENYGCLFLIQKGVLRGCLKIGKKEITTWIADEQRLVLAPESNGLQVPHHEIIEALENCQIETVS